MPHFGFILASYLSSIAIMAAMALWLFLDNRKQKNALRALEARGVRRRSDPASKTSATPRTTGQVTE
uniref:heme exporter protein CcmD n=1 Tax=Pararhizobium sp. IMCC3301 TaxID=3067904 RepID=UPI002741906C|nr:heme exporter protein CcmD [Pararhizobium sp. IMCC3301]